MAGFSNRFSAKVSFEPLTSQMRHFVQRARLLKQMGRATHDLEVLFCFELLIGAPIEF